MVPLEGANAHGFYCYCYKVRRDGAWRQAVDWAYVSSAFPDVSASSFHGNLALLNLWMENRERSILDIDNDEEENTVLKVKPSKHCLIDTEITGVIMDKSFLYIYSDFHVNSSMKSTFMFSSSHVEMLLRFYQI